MLDTRTLVLDDDSSFVRAIARGLLHTVRHVDTALEGARALELFAIHRHPIVVLDLMMPEMDGFEVMTRIHRIDPRTQFIMVTGYATVENAQQAVNRHAFGFLRKPFGLAELEHLVIGAFSDYQERSGRNNLSAQPVPRAPDDNEIEALYREVSDRSCALERAPSDPELQAAYQESFARLRSVQAQEAELASRAFRDNLALKKGMGYSSIEAARRVLDRDKGST